MSLRRHPLPPRSVCPCDSACRPISTRSSPGRRCPGGHSPASVSAPHRRIDPDAGWLGLAYRATGRWLGVRERRGCRQRPPHLFHPDTRAQGVRSMCGRGDSICAIRPIRRAPSGCCGSGIGGAPEHCAKRSSTILLCASLTLKPHGRHPAAAAGCRPPRPGRYGTGPGHGRRGTGATTGFIRRVPARVPSGCFQGQAASRFRPTLA